MPTTYTFTWTDDGDTITGVLLQFVYMPVGVTAVMLVNETNELALVDYSRLTYSAPQ